MIVAANNTKEDMHVHTDESACAPCQNRNLNRLLVWALSIGWLAPVIHLVWHSVAMLFGLPCL